MDNDVTRHTDPDRFEVEADGVAAGFAQFVDHDGQRIFFHTVVEPAFGGRGLGGVLVGGALTATRDEGLRVVPVCPFVKGYVDKHPEWADLVDQPTEALIAAIPR